MAWGDNTYGQTNTPSGLANAVKLAAGGYHNLALASDGRPALTVQPVGQAVAAGMTVLLQAMAVGLQPLDYQWTFNGANLAGATANALLLTNVGPAQAGGYALVITNVGGLRHQLGGQPDRAAVRGDCQPQLVAGPGISITFPSVAGHELPARI